MSDGPWWLWPVLLTVIAVLVVGVMAYYGDRRSEPQACSPTSGYPCSDAQEGGGVVLIRLGRAAPASSR
jgi:hypothetical protein